MLSIENGVHTFSVGMTLTHKQFTRIFDACYKTGCVQDTSDIWKGKERLYCYAYQEQGVKVFLHGKSGKLYRLRIQIEPCRVLGETDPTALAEMGKRQYNEFVKSVDKSLKKLKLPVSIDDMKISRCDLTINVYFATQEELMEYLRVLKKSFNIRCYQHVFFKKDDEKTKNHKTANSHSHCIACNSASFLIYDKIAQLEMIDRCDETMIGKHVLRLEAELKRPALKTHLKKSAMDTNFQLLSTAAKKSKAVIRWYLNRMQPKCEKYLRYEDAVRKVKEAGFKKKTIERMLYLLRKTSDSESLTAAMEKLIEKFNLSTNQWQNVLKKFQKLGISPITLTNSSEFDEIPSLFP